MAEITRSRSRKYFEDAEKVLVGGVNSPVRSFRGVGGGPLIMKRGERQYLYDVDGKRYTDYCLSWGALILGHANRNMVLNAKKTIERGSSFGTTTRDEIDLASLIVERVPSVERIRFVNSGTEAAMSAIRLARGFTKRELIIKFDGCYHGHFDDLLTVAGSGVAQLQNSSSAGVPRSHIQNTISLPYNDVGAFQDAVRQHGEKIACVIVEPVAGNMGVIRGTKEFLTALRAETKTHGMVLIFDEIMSGFRSQSGCVQGDVNIIPDITCLGKIIGGGFPVGAYGGRKEIMDNLAPLGGVYQAGTFSGNPAVMRAGYASLKLLNSAFYKSLNQKCEDFVSSVNAEFSRLGVDAHLASYASMISLRFRKAPVRNYEDAQKASGGTVYADLFHHLLHNGIYWPPADLEAFFVSGVHQKKDLNHLKDALVEFFKRKDHK